jgi:hypothetical protein
LDIVDDATNALKYLLKNDTADLPSDGEVYEKLSSMQFIGVALRVAWAVLKVHYRKTNNNALSSVLLDPRYHAKMFNEMGMAESIQEHLNPFLKTLYQTFEIKEHSTPTNLVYSVKENCDFNLPHSTNEPSAVMSLYTDSDSIQDIESQGYCHSQRDKLQKTDSNFKVDLTFIFEKKLSINQWTFFKLGAFTKKKLDVLSQAKF